MANLKKLRETIEDSGMTIVAIARKSGVERATLYNKINGKSDFKISEVMSLTKVLQLSEEQRNAIFFDE